MLEELFKSNNDVKLRTAKSHIQRPIQYLYPIEMHWDMEESKSKSKNTSQKKLSVDVKE